MKRHLALIVAGFLLSFQALAQKCDVNVPCDKCAKDSEKSWNPDNRFVTGQLNRFYSMEDLIKGAYGANDLAEATRLANEYLSLAETYRCNWNYGNAIHDANRFLGLISLKKGDPDAAAQSLLKAGKSTGSPQLDSFGPDLDLASALLKEGRVEPVKEYLREIQRFWKMDNGQVADWLASIEKGEKPELNRFAMKPSITQLVLIGFSLAWPALVVLGFLYRLRARIARKWLFGIIAIVSGYLAMMIAGWISAFAMPMIITSVDSTNVSLIMAAMYAGMAATFVFPLLAVWGVSRYFRESPPAS